MLTTGCCHKALSIFFIILLLLSPSLTAAASASGSDKSNWANVQALSAGKQISVERQKGLGKKVTGRFVSCDDNGLTLRTDKGEELVQKKDIRNIKTATPGRKGIIAAAICTIIGGWAATTALAIHDSRQHPLNSTPGRAALDVAPGIGGSVIGVLLAKSAIKVVYEAPRH